MRREKLVWAAPPPPPPPAATSPRGAYIRNTRPGAASPASPASVDDQNFLAGPAAVALTGPPLAEGKLDWPVELTHTFAISIRPLRFQGLQARLGPWATHVQLWRGTNGHLQPKSEWERQGLCSRGSTLKLGEIGCFDSHYRVWEHVVRENLPMACIMEDDLHLRYCEAHEQRLRSLFAELRGAAYDFVYLGGRSWKKENVANPSPGIAYPQGCNGLFFYLVTQAGARKLMAKAKPYALPADVYVERAIDNGDIQALAADPSICYVLPVFSDTANMPTP